MTLSMKIEIRDQWVEELRSGNYLQGAGELHAVIPKSFDDYEERYCCLGILCRMATQAGVVEAERTSEDNLVYYGGESAYLPREVIDWAGLTYEGERTYTESLFEESRGILHGGLHVRPDDVRSLTVMNDSGIPFDEIAATIEVEVIGV